MTSKSTNDIDSTAPGPGSLLQTYFLPLPDPQSSVPDMPMIAANETIYAAAQGRVFNLSVGDYQPGSDLPYFDTGSGAGGQALAAGSTYLYAAAKGTLYIRNLTSIETPLGLDTSITSSTELMNVICFPSGNETGDDWVFVSTSGDANDTPGWVYFYSVPQDGSAPQLIATTRIGVINCDSPEEVRMACDGTYLWAGINGYMFCFFVGEHGLSSAITDPVDFRSCWGLVDVITCPNAPGTVYASCGGRVYMVYLDGDKASYLENSMSGTPSCEIRLAASSEDSHLFIATIYEDDTYTVWKLDPNDNLDTVGTVIWQNAGTDDYCVVPILFSQDGVLLASGMYYPIQIDPATLHILIEFTASPRSSEASSGASATSPKLGSNIHPTVISEIAYLNGAVYVAMPEGVVNAYSVEPAA